MFYLAGKFEKIFDIGANIGTMTLYAKIQGVSKRILLADPNIEALQISFKNLLYNNFLINCDFTNKFIGDTVNNEIKFYTIGTGAAGSIYKSNAYSAKLVNSYFTVPTTTIDQIVNELGWEPQFLKIDVEGAEALVLNGAKQLALKNRAWFLVEMHSCPELSMAENISKVSDWGIRHNYTLWFMRKGKILEKSEGCDLNKFHLLLLPHDIKYPKELIEISEGQSIPK